MSYEPDCADCPTPDECKAANDCKVLRQIRHGNRATPSAVGAISDARINELVRNVFLGFDCPDVSISECIEYAIRTAVTEATVTPSATGAVSIPREQLAKWESWARVRGNEVSPEAERPSFLSDGLADEMKAALESANLRAPDSGIDHG